MWSVSTIPAIVFEGGLSVRRITLLSRMILTFIFIFVYSACSRHHCTEPGCYHNKEKGFLITFPKEWNIEEGDGETEPIVEAVSPWEDDEDRFSEYVSVDIEELAEKMSLEDYFLQLRKEQSLDFPYFEEHDRGDVAINNRDAKWILFDVGSSEGIVRVLGFVLIKGKRGYLISCVAEGSKYDSYAETFEEIAYSFRLE